MKVLILGGAGMLGPHVIPALAPHFELRVTDIQPLPIPFEGAFQTVDVANFEQVLAAAEGMEAIINLSVLRQDRVLAFEVNTLGCYNMMRAAAAHGIKRIINTGPHFTVAGPTYEFFDYDLSPDMPPQPGTNLYALTKSLGLEICRVFSQAYDVSVQTYLFYNFRDPAEVKPGMQSAPFAVSWGNAAEVFRLGLEIDLDALPSRCEVFNILTDMPHSRFSNEKAKRVLGFQPRDDISGLWRKGD
jgi:nucleoside-diphosphate-sugar epimerase